MTNDEQPNFHLSRGEAATLVYALDEYRAAQQKLCQRARRETSHKPGKAAGYAMSAASAQLLRERLMTFCVDNGWLSLKPERATQ